MKNATKDNIYLPGNCNIGPEEIKRRYRIGFAGLLLMVVYIFCVEWLDLARVYKSGLFFPAFLCFSGFFQGAKRFCFVYGWKGLVSLSGNRKFMSVSDKVYLRQDRTTALLLVVLINICSVLVAGFYFMI